MALYGWRLSRNRVLVVKVTKMKYVFFIGIAILMSCCKADGINFESMESSEMDFNKRQGKELVAFMSLETMFPNRQVRALAEAAGQGNLKKVESLITQGVDVNSRGTKNATPLFWAMRNIDGFEKLLELGADPNIVFADSSVMHWAARHENVSFLRMALIHGGNPDLVVGKLGETPIFKTIGVTGSGNRIAMIILLESGANIDATTGGGEVFGMSMAGKTPIMTAADLGRFDIVYDLLSRGANYDSEDDSGRDLMDRVVSMNGRYVAGSEQERSLEIVIEWLNDHGVYLPQ